MDNSLKRKLLLFSALISILLFFASVYASAMSRAINVKAHKRQWKYIIIHHSATRKGNAKIFAKAHRKRGMKNGLAYHFVIDNGTCGKRDGQLEIGNRWKRQIQGGGCRQNYYNQTGIHICLVGNFTNKPPSRRQIHTLILLVNALRKQYNISLKRIIGHGQIKGEQTKCPGKKFPWRDFYRALRRIK